MHDAGCWLLDSSLGGENTLALVSGLRIRSFKCTPSDIRLPLCPRVPPRMERMFIVEVKLSSPTSPFHDRQSRHTGRPRRFVRDQNQRDLAGDHSVYSPLLLSVALHSENFLQDKDFTASKSPSPHLKIAICGFSIIPGFKGSHN